jgi:hypothetical protein
MKLIGHAWVAVNAVPQGNKKLLMLGSILPEIMYYTKDHPFKFEEIHEGGDKVYKYLRDKLPEFADLGLGMLAHSVKKGADRFNLDENLVLLGYSGKSVEKLRTKLSSILHITYETAKIRAHNILELAVELGIIKNYPDFIDEFREAVGDKETREKIKSILSECFRKPYQEVSRVVDELFGKIKPDYFKDAKGLALLWRELSSALPDPEPDIKQLAKLLSELSTRFNGRDEEFLEKAVDWTKSSVEGVSGRIERKGGKF